MKKSKNGLTINDGATISGNTVIPVGSVIGKNVKIETGAKFNGSVEIGQQAKIGNFVNFGKWIRIRENSTLGDFVSVGSDSIIYDNANIGRSFVAGSHCMIFDGSTIGSDAEIGKAVSIGDRVTIGNRAEIASHARIGRKFKCEGLEVIDFFAMENVDGSGRKIYIYFHTKGISVRAGCFLGTLDQFCDTAEAEDKHLYAVTVRAAAEAFAAECRRQGKTGGW